MAEDEISSTGQFQSLSPANYSYPTAVTRSVAPAVAVTARAATAPAAAAAATSVAQSAAAVPTAASQSVSATQVVNPTTAAAEVQTATTAPKPATDTAAASPSAARAAAKIPPSAQEIQEAVAKANANLASAGRSMDFSVDRTTGITITTIRNSQTGAVLQQIPGADIIALARMLADWSPGQHTMLDLFA